MIYNAGRKSEHMREGERERERERINLSCMLKVEDTNCCLAQHACM